MTVTENLLEIILITYNRKMFLKRTLDRLLAGDSPVRSCSLTVLDNNSTDGTGELVSEYVVRYANVSYVKNPYNVGGNGNIAKAMERGKKEYLWVLCDDDDYCWKDWSQVEAAMMRGELVISTCDFGLSENARTDVAYLLTEMTFLPSIVFNTKLFTDTTMRNVYDNIFVFFPHLVPIVTHLNHGGTIHAIRGNVILRDCQHAADLSYVRGACPEDLFQRSKTMSFIVGYCNIIANLKNRKLARRCFDVIISGAEYFQRIGYLRLFGESFLYLRGRENDMQIVDLMMQCPWWARQVFRIVHFVQNTCLYPLVVFAFYKMLRMAATIECTH